ncbi:FimV family protein [Pseudoduganella sp.]|uniref:type IV pilus assembly protein FimV n=1 Tax=Pseudoduganella sp. TaxID=1880898 RepID=UPI0035ADD2FD
MLSKRLTLGALVLPLLAATLCGPVRAAELGEVKVNSYLGQQLSADIELVDLTPADLAEIQARLANPDVFKGAGLSVPPALAGLYISVAKRDNRRFLHLTTLQPVNVEGLHLFLELSSGGRQIIRAATLWLTPEPPAQRAARTAALAAATPAAAPLPAPAPSPPPAPTPAAPAAPLAKPDPAGQGEAGLTAAAERAFTARKQASAKVPAQPAAASAASEPKAAPGPVKAAAVARPVRAEAAALTTNTHPAAAPAQACVPAQVEAQIQQCQAMTGKLVDLEGKVQRLQQALAVPPSPSAAPVAASSAGSAAASVAAASAAQAASATSAPAKEAAAPAKPEPAPSKPGAKPTKPGATPEQEAKSRSKWIMVAAGSLAGLAVLGGVIYFLRKRRGQGPLKIWQSFRKKEEPAAAAEPIMEEAATQE